MDLLSALFRWIHILAGITWIGMLYFFNFVNGPFQGTIDGDTKKKVNPELMPRALWWFRWGAAWTWVTGVLLLLLVFYHGGIMFQPDHGWSVGAHVMIAVTFLAVFLYDVLAKNIKDPKALGTVSFALVVVVVYLMAAWGDFSYRAFNIHLASLFGTIMAFNVWYRIWPAQQKILTAVKEGTAADPALVALGGSRSRHNTYMSAALIWGMINSHTTTLAGGNFGLTESTAFLAYPVFILVAWHVIWHLYKRAPKVKGF